MPLGEFFVQDHIEQRLVNLDAFVVFDKAEFAKSIYEEAHAGTRCASTYPPVRVVGVAATSFV